MLHSTRGGKEPGRELLATCNWFLTRESGVSAHVVIGRTGALFRFVAPDLVAYHARELNETYLGIEFEQGLADEEFSGAQIVVGAYVVRQWSRQFGFPVNRNTVVGHDETAPGKRDRKTDPGPLFDWPRFIGLCLDPSLALPEELREYASAEFGDLLDAANSLHGIARLNDRQRAAGLALVQRAAEELAVR